MAAEVTARSTGFFEGDLSKFTGIYDTWEQKLMSQTPTGPWIVASVKPIIFLTLLYLPIVYGLKIYYRNRPAYPGKIPLVIWNFSLSILSAMGSFALIFLSNPLNLLRRNLEYEDHSTAANIAVTLFCLTKVVEYGDTFLLCIKKRPTIFLHLYHHITVALYCLHAIYYQAPYGHIFAFVNLNIHAIMYAYYGFAIMDSTKKLPIMRAIRPYITTIQLLQMFLGTAIAYVECLFPSDCAVSETSNRYLALAMYLSYAYLFGDFWIKNYTNCAPVRTLLGVSPIVLMAMSAPLVFLEKHASSVSLSQLGLLLGACGAVCSFMKHVGNSPNLTITSMVFPMAATAWYDGVPEGEVAEKRTIKLFEKGHSPCVDIIRYSTLPVTIVTLGCRHSPLAVTDLNIGMAMLALSTLWVATGVKAGCFKVQGKVKKQKTEGGKKEESSDTMSPVTE